MNRRNTIQKQLISRAVSALDHPDAEQVYEYIVKDHPHVSKATVYRNLNLLAKQGEIGKIETSDGAARFDFYTAPHYHLRCRKCGRLFDADMLVLTGLETRLGETGGFTVEKHIVEFIGICSGCKK